MAWPELYHHTVDADTMRRMERVRRSYITIGDMLERLPDGRSKSLAKMHLEDSLMRATQALALLGEQQTPDNG